jgi:aerobic-type carbon monoxide dehydrogenase small subunit (CoxS/CutS family)
MSNLAGRDEEWFNTESENESPAARSAMASVTINGVEREVDDPSYNLLSFIRYELGLTGTKYGCGEGLCGACTVLVDGQPLRSCETAVESVLGSDLVTIEGLAKGEALHPVQQAFVEASAMQCGYCIPGFIMESVGLLNRNPQPSSEQIREALAENMCRCGTYQRIQQAVELAAQRIGGRP